MFKLYSILIYNKLSIKCYKQNLIVIDNLYNYKHVQSSFFLNVIQKSRSL